MEYNPFLPEVRENPYPYYAYLRQHAPVYQVPGLGFSVASRYEEVFFMLRNPHLFSSSPFFSALTGDLNPFPPEAPAMIGSDPPSHTRLRKLVNRAFTPRRIASLEARLREMTDQLFDQAKAQSQFDVVRDLAIPLPVMGIAELLGVPTEMYREFKGWADSVVRATNGSEVTAQEREEILRDFQDFHRYFEDIITMYRKQPGDNLLSDLVRAEEEKQTLTSAEVQSMALLVLIAGAETTTNLIGNITMALLKHPEQLAKVRANPSLAAQVVEETVRYDTPVQALFRAVTQDVELGGTPLPAGSILMVLFGSANRDERKFPDPDRYDITRNTDGHVGFGFGIHFCLGAQLARLEAKIALEALLQRFPRFSLLDDNIPRVQSIAVRGPKTLPLVMG
jgi:cytochrome P450